MIKHIQAGALDLRIAEGAERLETLIDFASRENHKRGFLFVSKILGKHIPVAPGEMRAIYDELADLCQLDRDAYVIGMAETATGLGAGIADSLSKQHPRLRVFYQHTTRHQLDHPVWLTLDEIHSHAVNHILYQPHAQIIQQVQTLTKLILVDDEITTGTTLLRLATGVLTKIPSIQAVIIVSLASWLSPEDAQKFAALGVKIRFIQLLKGRFTFTPNPHFSARLPENVDDAVRCDETRNDLGRIGLKMPYQLTHDDITSHTQVEAPTVVVGTGEHLYYPFLLAERLSARVDTVFQSTTRSPILPGDAIQRKIYFDVGRGKVNFIYNLPRDRAMLVCCENPHCVEKQGLLKAIENECAAPH